MKDDNEKLNLDSGIKSTASDKINRIMRDWMIDIVIVLMIGTYILTMLIKIEIKNTDIFSILGDSALLLTFLIAIKTLMLRKGIFVGEKNEGYILAKAQYDAQLLKAMQKSQYLADYLAEFNAREHRDTVSRVLAQYAMNYEEWKKGIENPTKIQQAGIKAANRAKSLRVKVTDLTGNGVTDEKKPSLGKSKNEFMKSKSLSTMALTVLSVVIFSVFTARIAGDFNWSSLIWIGLQIVVFLIKGVTSFYSAYVFIKDEYTNRLIRQTNILIDFDNMDVEYFEKKREEARKQAEEEKRNAIEEETERKRIDEERRIAEERKRIDKELLLLATTEEKEKLENERKELEEKNARLIKQLEFLRSKEIAQSMSDISVLPESTTESFNQQNSTNQTESTRMTELANNEEQNNEITNNKTEVINNV